MLGGIEPFPPPNFERIIMAYDEYEESKAELPLDSRQIPQEIELLKNEVDFLTKSIGKLHSKLEPIINIAPPQEETDKLNVVPDRVPLASDLFKIRTLISQLTSKVELITQLTEI